MIRNGDSEIRGGFVIHIILWSNSAESCLSVREGAMREKTKQNPRDKYFCFVGKQLHDCKDLGVDDHVVKAGCPQVAESSAHK